MPDSEEFDARPVRTFLPTADQEVDESVWPTSVPAMAQLLREGLEVPAGLTVLVGENGSGKSTVVESLAEAYGLNPQGGSALARSFQIRESEPCVGGELTVVRGIKPRWSYFLRADGFKNPGPLSVGADSSQLVKPTSPSAPSIPSISPPSHSADKKRI